MPLIRATAAITSLKAVIENNINLGSAQYSTSDSGVKISSQHPLRFADGGLQFTTTGSQAEVVFPPAHPEARRSRKPQVSLPTSRNGTLRSPDLWLDQPRQFRAPVVLTPRFGAVALNPKFWPE